MGDLGLAGNLGVTWDSGAGRGQACGDRLKSFCLGSWMEPEAAQPSVGASRGRGQRALSTWRTRFILPMWIMKPSVQAMSEGEWPPPTTFTLLFCCLARASTCQHSARISPAFSFLLHEAEFPGPAGAGHPGLQGPFLTGGCCEGLSRRGPGRVAKQIGSQAHPKGAPTLPAAAGGFSASKPHHLLLRDRTSQGAPQGLHIKVPCCSHWPMRASVPPRLECGQRPWLNWALHPPCPPEAWLSRQSLVITE